MNKKFWRKALRPLFFGIFFSAVCTVQAGGPLLINNNQPVLWPSSGFPIPYRLDPGALGPLTHEQAATLIDTAFNTWQSAPGSSIQLVRGADLAADVTSTNMYQYMNGLPKGVNPILFDSDGSIVRALYGVGAELDILGFAGPTLYSGQIIQSAQAVFNGKIIETANLSNEAVFSTLLHELGHFLGLDHAQLYRHLAYDGIGWDDRYVPILFPYATDDDFYHTHLTDEDAHSLASLYPSSNQASETGILRGIVQRGAKELPGINIIAQNVDAVTNQIYTTVSGTSAINRGTFEFTGLPPGVYRLFIEPIDPSFTDISSVGRYAQSISDKSFQNPPPMQGYSLEGTSTGRSAWTPLTVTAGSALENIVINARTNSAPSDETNTALLLYDTPLTGALAANDFSLFQFLFSPQQSQTPQEIRIQSNTPEALFDLYIQPDRPVTTTDLASQSSFQGQAAVRLKTTETGSLNVERYFIAVRNQGTQPFSFTITASILPQATPTPLPTLAPSPSPTAVEINPALGLVALDEVGGTYPRGTAADNFDIGISDENGKLTNPNQYDGVPDSSALGPFLIFNNQYFPIAQDIDFSGETDPNGNGSEGVYFLIGGYLDHFPPVSGRLGATGGPNHGGIDADNNPDNNLDFGGYSGDYMPVQSRTTDQGLIYGDFLVDLEPAGNNGFYALDRSGRIYAEGSALESLDTASPPTDMDSEFPAVALTIYRGRKVSLANSRYSDDLTGTGAYILDQRGAIHTLGDAPALHTDNIPLLSSNAAFVYHDMQLIPNPEGTEFIGLGALRGDGILFFALFVDVEITQELRAYLNTLIPFGDQDSGFSLDIARRFAVEISDQPIYGKDETGQTIASSGRRVGVILVDGFGGIQTGGRSTRYIPMQEDQGTDRRIIQGVSVVPLSINIPYFGVDVIRGMAIAPPVIRPTTGMTKQ